MANIIQFNPIDVDDLGAAVAVAAAEGMLTPLVCTTLLVINLFSCAAEPDVKVKVVVSNCLPLPTSRHSKTASALESFLSAKPTLTDCHRKLRIILRINNCAKIKNEDLYVFLDEAEDEESNATLKLLEPIVVKFHQHPVALAHGLHYLGSVNGKLAEAVHFAPNVSSQKSIDACFSNDLSQFLCGYDGDELYPKGFCCPCVDEDCADESRERRCTATDQNPTTHCLRESPYWYFATALAPAVMYHALEMQLFQRVGSGAWRSLTDASGIFVSTDNPISAARDGSVVAKYLGSADPDILQKGALPYDTHRLLIPHYIPEMLSDDLPPHMVNGARDYLLLPNSMIDLSDTQCGKVGTYFKAFWNQDNRCQRPVSSCLEVQPLDLWSQDNERRSQGLRGRYLLENHAKPLESPILLNDRTGRRYFGLGYEGQHLSMASLEFSADSLRFETSDHQGSVTEVTTNAVLNLALIRMYAANTGTRPEVVTALIRGCSFGFCSNSTDRVRLSPGEKRLLLLSVRIDVTGGPAADVWCNVVLENQARGIITTRSVLIRPKGRCVCYLDCQCTCMGESVVCRPETAVNRNKRRTMAQTEARAVAARLSHPRVTHPSRFYDIPVPLYGSPPGNPSSGNPSTRGLDSDDPDSGVVSCGLSVALSALEVFVSIGLLKAVIGLASQPVALWGLRNFVSQLESTIWLSEQATSGDGEKTKRSERCRVGPLVLFCMNLFCCCMLPLVLCGVAEDMSRRRAKEGQEERSKVISPKKAGLATSKV